MSDETGTWYSCGFEAIFDMMERLWIKSVKIIGVLERNDIVLKERLIINQVAKILRFQVKSLDALDENKITFKMEESSNGKISHQYLIREDVPRRPDGNYMSMFGEGLIHSWTMIFSWEMKKTYIIRYTWVKLTITVHQTMR